MDLTVKHWGKKWSKRIRQIHWVPSSIVQTLTDYIVWLAESAWMIWFCCCCFCRCFKHQIFDDNTATLIFDWFNSIGSYETIDSTKCSATAATTKTMALLKQMDIYESFELWLCILYVQIRVRFALFLHRNRIEYYCFGQAQNEWHIVANRTEPNRTTQICWRKKFKHFGYIIFAIAYVYDFGSCRFVYSVHYIGPGILMCSM